MPEARDRVRDRDGRVGTTYSGSSATPVLTAQNTWRMVVLFEPDDVRAVEVYPEPYHDPERGALWQEVAR